MVQNKYPIYIISKGRWESRLTAKYLEEINIPYRIVIEPQEYDQYAAVISKEKIITLPFSNLGLGGIPARNFVWEHSINEGHERHWILDDNINGWGRLNYNQKTRLGTGVFFKIIEDFVDRYENIGMAGCEYDYFLPRKVAHKPYRLNTRIYSNILIKNDITHRWRGRYNEDTDLSIRILKDGMCTILFQAFYAYKVPTLQMKGGNTDVLYNQGDKRLEFANSLKEQHPDIVEVVWRYNRWHHQVDYRMFKTNKLIKKDGIIIKDGINNYGMVFQDSSEQENKEHINNEEFSEQFYPDVVEEIEKEVEIVKGNNFITPEIVNANTQLDLF